jgi:adenylosuccinate lyase
MFALDGSLETFLTVLQEMDVYESSIASELRRQLPFLATTTLLMEAVKAGGGRETLHEVIREHSVAAARGLRDGSLPENDLAARLDADRLFPLRKAAIQAVLADPARFLGAAPQQVDAFIRRVDALRQKHPQAAEIKPDEIL